MTEFREQVADLILKTPEGNDMIVCSNLTSTGKSCIFDIMDPGTQQKFRVTVTHEEIE